MHGGVHPREVGAPYWPRVARDGVLKKQLLDHDIIRLAGCVPQPPDSVPPHMKNVSKADVSSLYLHLLICQTNSNNNKRPLTPKSMPQNNS